jgi:hypothetical protein
MRFNQGSSFEELMPDAGDLTNYETSVLREGLTAGATVRHTHTSQLHPRGASAPSRKGLAHLPQRT